MKKINFLFGLHNHQPVGNFDFVFENAYRQSYKPLLDVFAKYPDFKFTIHYTGILMEWIEKNHPEHFEQLKEMVNRGQAELLSGGFYEPILSVIPERDARSQIVKQNSYIKKNFAYNPRGMWTAERIWEPHLPLIMNDASMEFTVLDDTHFKYAGIKDEGLRYHYVTETSGKSVRVFPIDKTLRYTIPFQAPRVTIDYLKSLASDEKDILVVFADDGEKFGTWPGTYDRVFKEKWLEMFIEEILKNGDVINQMHFSEAVDNLAPKGPIYLPVASYAEMMEWTLPTDAFEKYVEFEEYLKKQEKFDEYDIFVRGGFWRNFLTKYSESNNMHKKMVYVSSKIEKLRTAGTDRLLDEAYDHLLASQCNCGYWHGVFGGLYLNHLRNAIYKNLIQAEKKLDDFAEINGLKNEPFTQFDINMDGKDELLLETANFNLYFAPAQGGMLYELDYKPKEINLLDSFTRKKEGSHRKLLELAAGKDNNRKTDDDSIASIHDLVVAKEEGLENYLIYDDYEKKSFIDHFFSADIDYQALARNEYREAGDFIKGEYSAETVFDDKGVYTVILEREGEINLDGEKFPVKIEKKITVHDADKTIRLKLKIINGSGEKISVKTGVEMNFAMLAGHSPDRYYFSADKDLAKAELASSGMVEKGNELGIHDEYSDLKIVLNSDKKADIIFFPVETISLSEAGFERVYQSSNIFFIWDLDLENEWEVELEKRFS